MAEAEVRAAVASADEATVEEAIVDGDVALSPNELRIRPGTARSALRAPKFRRLWFATFSSNIGTWMQNVALAAFAYHLTHSDTFVALIGFGQLGPLLLLAPVGGLLADLVDRRRLLVITNLEQLVFSGVLAWVATLDHPSRGLLMMVVVAIGIGNALTGPPLSSLLPNLVPRVDMPGAISLQSVQMNLSRVIGPAIGGVLIPTIHVSGVFAINAATYLFAVLGAVVIGRVPHPPSTGETGFRRIFGGIAVARRDPVVRGVLLTIASISFFSLPFIGLFPVIGAQNLHLNVLGFVYGALFACFGLGAASGAIAVGSILVGYRREVIIPVCLVMFGVMLVVFGELRSVGTAFPVVFFVGFFYFGAVTTLSTRLQAALDDSVRGRVMALYMMCFGGTVPLGLLASGPIANATSVTDVLVGGGVITLVIAAAATPKSFGQLVRQPRVVQPLEDHA